MERAGQCVARQKASVQLEVFVRADALHGADGIFYGAKGGDHDDGLLGIVLAQIAQDLQAIAIGQGVIEQHQVEGLLGQQRQPFLATAGHCDGVAFQFQQGLQGFADLRLVVDDQNASRAR